MHRRANPPAIKPEIGRDAGASGKLTLNRAAAFPRIRLRMGLCAIELPVPQSGDASKASAARTGTGTLFLVCMGIYFGLHVVTRTLVSNNLQLDEAEQMVLTQDWLWGYGSQPPLYNWLQKLLFSLLGANVFALSLLKNTLLWSLYLFVYLAAREILSHGRLAMIAAASLLLMPQIAWDSQRDLTHLILATVCAAATLFVFVRLLKTQRSRYYAAFGALAGLGMMSKYNYLAFAVALLAGAFTLPQLRPALALRRMWLAALAFLLVTAPHLHWLLFNKALALSQTYKFDIEPSGAGSSAYIQGGLRFAKVLFEFLVTPVLLYLPLLLSAFKTGSQAATNKGEGNLLLKLLLRALLFGLVLSLLLVLVFRVTFIRGRWMEPLLFALPILLVGWARSPLEAGRGKYLLWLAGAAAAFVLGAINGTVLGANVLHRSHNLKFPHAALADELRRSGFQKGVIVADGFFLGGNMKMHFKTSRVIVSDAPREPPASTEDKLIIWDTRGLQEPSAKFLAFASSLCGTASSDWRPTYVEVPADNGPKRAQRIGFVLMRGQLP